MLPASDPRTLWAGNARLVAGLIFPPVTATGTLSKFRLFSVAYFTRFLFEVLIINYSLGFTT